MAVQLMWLPLAIVIFNWLMETYTQKKNNEKCTHHTIYEMKNEQKPYEIDVS